LSPEAQPRGLDEKSMEEEKAQPLTGPPYNLSVTKRPIKWQYFLGPDRSWKIPTVRK
jgi:hypothetical protein